MTHSQMFASESVTEGHPDKLCDQIADAILDAYLEGDPLARVACEVLAAKDLILIAGEFTSCSTVDYDKVAREVTRDIGYIDEEYGIDAKTCRVLLSASQQSSTVAGSVDIPLERMSGIASSEAGDRLGAGDQSIVIGYACDETPQMLPMPLVLAHSLARRLSEVRKQQVIPYLRPDGKALVVLEYLDSKPARASAILISTQHDPRIPHPQVKSDIINCVVQEVVPLWLRDSQTRILVNPSGGWAVGGPRADTGVTGRKLAVDTYGGLVRYGGGALCGKDPTKIDRTGAYGARYAAKNLVAAGLARKVEIQVVYGIGLARPIGLSVETFGTGEVDDSVLTMIVKRCFDFRPASLIQELDLQRPIYRHTAVYGHFGREDEKFTWEICNRVQDLQAETSRL